MALWAFLAVAVTLIGSRGADALFGGLGTVVRDIGAALPKAATQSSLILPDVGPGGASSGPIFDDLPSVTSKERILIIGRVPSYAMDEGRKVTLSVNGEPLGAFPYDKQGRFGAEVNLKEGANAVFARIVTAKNEVVSVTQASVVLDRSAPTLTLSSPRSGERIVGTEVVVQGRTTSRVAVQINGRTVAVTPDGAFTDALPASAGPFTITVLARNEAGVETTTRVGVTVAAPQVQTATLQVGVALDRLSAKPGDSMTATIVVTTAQGVAVPQQSVSLTIGLTPSGSQTTDDAGRATIVFTVPDIEGDVAVFGVASASSGRVVLRVAK